MSLSWSSNTPLDGLLSQPVDLWVWSTGCWPQNCYRWSLLDQEAMLTRPSNSCWCCSMSVKFITLSSCSECGRSKWGYSVSVDFVRRQDSHRVCGLLLLTVSLFPHWLDNIHAPIVLCVFTDRTRGSRNVVPPWVLIYTHHESSFFLTKTTVAPQGDLLYLMWSILKYSLSFLAISSSDNPLSR